MQTTIWKRSHPSKSWFCRIYWQDTIFIRWAGHLQMMICRNFLSYDLELAWWMTWREIFWSCISKNKIIQCYRIGLSIDITSQQHTNKVHWLTLCVIELAFQLISHHNSILTKYTDLLYDDRWMSGNQKGMPHGAACLSDASKTSEQTTQTIIPDAIATKHTMIHSCFNMHIYLPCTYFWRS